jgi:hypothetical protein
MALRDLVNDTTLKSLKYGSDQLGGGASGQPYVTTNVTDPHLTNLILAKGGLGSLLQRAGITPGVTINNIIGKDDGFVRGGIVGSSTSAIVDTVRVGSWILNNPLWVAKQVGLQLSNPRLETPKNISLLTNPGNLLSSGTNGILQPTRIYNLGINTLLQVPTNAFGVHFYRHGLGPTMDDNQKYEAIARANNDILGSSNNNRLLKLKDTLQIGTPTFSTSPLLSAFSNLISRIPFIGSIINSVIADNTPIDSYLTGPGSVYGIGSTLIKRYQNTTSTNLNEFKSIALTAAINNTRVADTSPKLRNYLRIPVSNDRTENENNFDQYERKTLSGNGSTSVKYAELSPALRKYDELFNATRKVTNITQEIPFSESPNYVSQGPSNSPFSVERKKFKTIANIGLNRDAKNYNYYGKKQVSPDGSVAKYNNTYVFDRYDSDILTVMFRGVDPFTQNEERWAFSAYLSGFKDDFNATWNDVNYIGRSETFYIYSKFRRSVSFSLKIPCFNRTQLFEKHRALGQLASTTAGRYNPNGTRALGGMLLRLNVGNYLVGEYATMNSLTYTVPDDASWDITPEARLAMYIEANFSFNIVHQKLPEYLPSKQFPEAGMFGYLPDSIRGNKEFIKIPNRTSIEQNSITEGFSVNLVATSSQGGLYTDIKPVIDPVFSEFRDNLRYTPPDPSEVDPNITDPELDNVSLGTSTEGQQLQPFPESTFTTNSNNTFRGF